jgi:hypothetical protein
MEEARSIREIQLILTIEVVQVPLRQRIHPTEDDLYQDNFSEGLQQIFQDLTRIVRHSQASQGAANRKQPTAEV